VPKGKFHYHNTASRLRFHCVMWRIQTASCQAYFTENGLPCPHLGSHVQVCYRAEQYLASYPRTVALPLLSQAPLNRNHILIALGLFLIAFVPVALPHHVYTVDETHFWLNRSLAFRDAMERGAFEETIITHHPGVLTMWLGWAGLEISDIFNTEGTMRDAHRMYFIAYR
jgi:hypothetical protein